MGPSISRDNSSGIGCGAVLMKSRARISRVIDKGGGGRQWG